MISGQSRRRAPGFTLTELLVVIAILASLAAMIYAASGGIREKGRQAVCISNLRQIGIAIAMYRQDYGGTDAPGWPAQMGLPPGGDGALRRVARPGGQRYLAGSDDVFFCPNFPADQRATAGGSYGWNPWGPDVTGIPGLPPFPTEVARRGSEFPLMYCSLHDFPPPDRPQKTRFVIVLRLDGRVSAVHTGSPNSWQW